MTPYGKLIATCDELLTTGCTEKIGFQRPIPMLFTLGKKSVDFAALLSRQLAQSPSSPTTPWSIILYQDGVDPSDGLSKNHSRKTCVFYWSFLELGACALSHEECWFTITILRELTVKTLNGAHARLTYLVLDQFLDDAGADHMAQGVDLQLQDGTTRTLHAKVKILLADEPALKEMTSCILSG